MAKRDVSIGVLVVLGVLASSCGGSSPTVVAHGPADATACRSIDTLYNLAIANKAPSTAQVNEVVNDGRAADDSTLQRFTADLVAAGHSGKTADVEKAMIRLAQRCTVMGIGPRN
ncbi:MAG TPA: hypothetical protein VGL48_13440 [Acidimicrobiales bacterium]